jgi:hypothetical protein
MSTITNDPSALLASEPKRKRGLKGPYKPEGDRTIRFEWAIGRGTEFNEPVDVFAVLEIHHYKASESRAGAHYRAKLWRETQRDGGLRGVKLDGKNGLTVVTSTTKAARFNEAAFCAFADHALGMLRTGPTDPSVLAYFIP